MRRPRPPRGCGAIEKKKVGLLHSQPFTNSHLQFLITAKLIPKQHLGARRIQNDVLMEMAVREWLRIQEPRFLTRRNIETCAKTR
jgi:hypothetical protein